MKPYPITFFAAMVLSICTVKAKADRLSVADTIPFERSSFNNIIVQAVLNKVDTVKLMFHTASSEITLIAESAKKLRSVRFDDKVEGVKSWGGQSNDSRMSQHNAVQVQALQWPDMPIWEDLNTGQGADGKIGLGLMHGKVVQLNFDKSLLVVSETLPPDIAMYQKLPLFFEKGNMFVDVNCLIGNREFENRFLIHTGYGGGLLFDDDFVVKHGLDTVLQSVGEKILHDAFGNEIVSKKVLVPSIKLGSVKLSNMQAGYFKGAAGLQRISIMGGDILKRFNIVIDGDRQFIYLKKQ